jgi:hypothetical protein
MNTLKLLVSPYVELLKPGEQEPPRPYPVAKMRLRYPSLA